jgi:transcriptional regulator with XRE-family HTH domain
MTSPESPAGARRRVRLAVREARETHGLTQSQVAEAMEWSHSKVIRIESGEVTISPNDLRPLLAYLGIVDKTTVDRLIRDARASRQRKMWWDETRVREHLTDASRQLIQYEVEAIEVRHFTTHLIPGPLQTDDYATTVLNLHLGQLSDEDVEVRLETRRRRRAQVLNRRDFPRTYLLLDESVLARRVGGQAAVTGDQLQHLLELAKQKPLWTRVLPYAANAPVAAIGPFDILSLPGEGANAVLYRESHFGDEIVDDVKAVQRHREGFETWWAAALDENASAALIERAVKELRQAGAPPDPEISQRAGSGPPVSGPARARRSRR